MGWSNRGLCSRGPWGRGLFPSGQWDTEPSASSEVGLGLNGRAGLGPCFYFSETPSAGTHSETPQLFSDGTELWKGRVHFLKILLGVVVGLWKQPDTTGLVPWGWHFSRAAAGTPDGRQPCHTLMHSYTHTCMRTSACACTHRCTHTHAHAHTCMHTNACAHTHRCMHARTHTHTEACIHVHI